VWNALLGMWNRVKSVPTFKPTPVNAPHGLEDFPIKVADLHAAEAEQALVATGQATELPDDAELSPEEDPVPHATLAPQAELPMARVATVTSLPVASSTPPVGPTLSFHAAQQAINSMASIDGLIGGAIVDTSTGMMLARHATDDSLVLELAAAGATQVLRAHQQAARQMGMTDEIDEIITSAGMRHHVMRTVSHHKGLFLFAVLDKQKTNLALARYKLMEAEQNLA
jgi:predicted regulator of Ras-like GTPase activity (Roadblock/LC7/MglB family)